MQIFQSFSPGREAAWSLMALRQGRRYVLDYAIEFRTLAADSGWNNAALTDAFLSGLCKKIKGQFISLDVPDELDDVIAITNKIGCRLQGWEKESSKVLPIQSHSSRPFARQNRPETLMAPLPMSIKPKINCTEPMQLGRARLSAEDRERSPQGRFCLYCGQPGHI